MIPLEQLGKFAENMKDRKWLSQGSSNMMDQGGESVRWQGDGKTAFIDGTGSAVQKWRQQRHSCRKDDVAATEISVVKAPGEMMCKV